MLLTRGQLIASTGLDYDELPLRMHYASEFLFHTQLCYRPHVLFDIGDVLYVEGIQIENRLGPLDIRKRAEALIVETSHDLLRWTEVTLSIDEGIELLSGLVQRNTRYIRCSLPSIGILHFKSIALDGVKRPCLDETSSINSEFGFFNKQIYYLRHEAGFFSICSTTLIEIAKSTFEVGDIDVSYAFKHYKDSPADNVWNKFFKPRNKSIPFANDVKNPFAHKMFHHDRYSEIDHSAVKSLLAKYFAPSDECLELVEQFKNRYAFDYDKTIVIYYRGTDKYIEIDPTPIESYIDAAHKLIALHPDYRVLVQTDQKQIKDILMNEFAGRVFCIDELPTTQSQVAIHKAIVENKDEFALNFLAVVLLMSKCKHLITSTGNVGYWITLFRGHSDRVVQI
jgi:hypothetical protein